MKQITQPLVDVFSNSGQEKKPFTIPRRNEGHSKKPGKGDVTLTGKETNENGVVKGDPGKWKRVVKGDPKKLHAFEQGVIKKEIPGKSPKEVRQDKFISAYCENMFNISKAAASVGIGRTTFYSWKTENEFIEKFMDAVESKKDWIENKLFQKVEQGDVAATIFCAKCLLSDRGYLPDKLMKLDVRHNEESKLNLTKTERDAIVAAASITPESIGLDFSKGKQLPH